MQGRTSRERGISHEVIRRRHSTLGSKGQGRGLGAHLLCSRKQGGWPGSGTVREREEGRVWGLWQITWDHGILSTAGVILFFVFFSVVVVVCLFRAIPMAYGSSQTRG